jgi:hypothetical protein
MPERLSYCGLFAAAVLIAAQSPTFADQPKKRPVPPTTLPAAPSQTVPRRPGELPLLIEEEQQQRVPEAAGMPPGVERLDFMPEEVEVLDVIPAAPAMTPRVLSQIGEALWNCIQDLDPFFNRYPSDPQRRMMVLMNQSENLRQIEHEMERFWMVDQPSHLTPERVHGGVGR